MATTQGREAYSRDGNEATGWAWDTLLGHLANVAWVALLGGIPDWLVHR